MTLALLTLLPQLLAAGVATVTQLKALFASTTPGMTDAEMNAVLGLIEESAKTQQQLAQADLKPNVGP
jgi:hypothetical protein